MPTMDYGNLVLEILGVILFSFLGQIQNGQAGYPKPMHRPLLIGSQFLNKLPTLVLPIMQTLFLRTRIITKLL
jgi:hypothetical protein